MWSFLFRVRCLWVTIAHHIHVSKPTFWLSLTQYAYSSTCTLLILCIKLLALQVRISEEHTTLRHHSSKLQNIRLRVKQGSKMHLSLRQNNLQLHNQAALISHGIWAIEHRCAAGLTCTRYGLQDQILLNYTRIENAHKVCKKPYRFFAMYVQRCPVNFFSGFSFSLLRHYEMPECFYISLTTAVF